MSNSSLTSVVSNLVRASMGSSVSNTVTDEDLDRHVAELILKEAKQKAERYLQDGVQAYLPTALPENNLPRANKRFLSAIIRSTDDHNKAVLRAQAEAAQEVKAEREAIERKERRARADEAADAERIRRLMGGSGRRRGDGDRGRDRDHERKRSDRSWERIDNAREYGEGGSSRRKRRRSRSRSGDRTERDSERRRRRDHDHDGDISSRHRRRRSSSRSGARKDSRSHRRNEELPPDRDPPVDTEVQIGGSSSRIHEAPRHASQSRPHSCSPVPSRTSQTAKKDTSSAIPEQAVERQLERSSPAPRRRPSSPKTRHTSKSRPATSLVKPVPSPPPRRTIPSPTLSEEEDIERRPAKPPRATRDRSSSPKRRHPLVLNPEPQKSRPSRSRKQTPPSPTLSEEEDIERLQHRASRARRRRLPSPVQSKSETLPIASSSRTSVPVSRTPSPTVPSSKMDKYFEPTYDPRLDVAPLAMPNIPSTGLINGAEFEGWEAMLEIIKQRREDKVEKKRLERLGLLPVDDDEKDKDNKVKKKGDKEADGRWTMDGGGGIMDIEYKKRGAVREWDVGKEGF